jgi:hypothetical protein
MQGIVPTGGAASVSAAASGPGGAELVADGEVSAGDRSATDALPWQPNSMDARNATYIAERANFVMVPPVVDKRARPHTLGGNRMKGRDIHRQYRYIDIAQVSVGPIVP